ncbi:MAG TPA: ATP-binding protein, partial [Planctomycetota bacterium]|nr:ATP-binding protein [Planctomycetota bacterium]
EEVGVFEPYEVVDWFVQRADEDDDGDELEVAEEPLEKDEVKVVHRPAVRFGFFRLASADELVYLWVFEQGPYNSSLACIATRRRAAWQRLVDEAELRHVAHERSRPGLVILAGKCGERRARAERVAWPEVLLPEGLREDIERTVSEFFASRDLYRRHRLAYRRGILLAGPPGNGKTTILKAIRTSARVPVIQAVVTSEGERGPLIERAFARAQVIAPCVLCFEDLDALIEDGPALSFFLNALDGLAPLDGILVIATTNRPDRIDPAIARRPSRFDRVWSIPAPDRGLRERYLAQLLGDDAPEGAAAGLAGRTEGFSMAFLKEIVVQARFASVRRGEARVADGDLESALEVASEHVRLATRGLEERGAIGFGK